MMRDVLISSCHVHANNADGDDYADVFSVFAKILSVCVLSEK